MSDKGNVNSQGMHIKVTEHKDKKGAKVSFYDKDPEIKDHKSIHLNVNYESKSWKETDNVNGKKEESSGSCYLTSACMNYYQKEFDDNCKELTVLRWFRNNFVSAEDIDHYNKTASFIVDAINKNPEAENIYKDIYGNVILPCVRAIENTDFTFAYDLYKTSILELEETFARGELQYRLATSLRRAKESIN